MSYNCLLWQTELRNTINKHAASFMKGFKDLHVITHLGQITGTCQSCRTGTDNSNLLAFLLLGRNRCNIVLSCPICCKTLKLTDGDRLTLDTEDTLAFTLGFLRAYTAAYCRKR